MGRDEETIALITAEIAKLTLAEQEQCCATALAIQVLAERYGHVSMLALALVGAYVTTEE